MNTLKLSAKTSALLLAPLFVSTIANSTPSLNDMGNIYSYYEISENGRLVYGQNTYQLWSGASSTQYTVPDVSFTGVSGDGRILSAVNFLSNSSIPVIYFTDTQTIVQLPLPSLTTGQAYAISMDGSIISGTFSVNGTPSFGYWTYIDGQISAPIITSAPTSGFDSDIIKSTNNTTSVGFSASSNNGSYSYMPLPFILDNLTGSYSSLPLNANSIGGMAEEISNNGLVVLGSSLNDGSFPYLTSPIIWKRNSSSESFSSPIRLYTYNNIISESALAISQATGEFAVGYAGRSLHNTDAIIWRTSDGYFANIGGLSGYTKHSAFGVSATGQFVYGTSNYVNGSYTPYRIF